MLPPFLVRLLRQHLETHPYEFVFTNACGSWLWRSTFDRRVSRPAIDGVRKPGVRVYPVCPGLTFHGLRHSHKTWLIAGGAPEIAQARRRVSTFRIGWWTQTHGDSSPPAAANIHRTEDCMKYRHTRRSRLPRSGEEGSSSCVALPSDRRSIPVNL
jgi:hypothetical protein